MRETWGLKPGDRVVRHPRESEIGPIHLTIPTRPVAPKTGASPLILIYLFVGIISVGTILLLMPFAHNGPGFTPFMDAVFTATSAATVTGLTVQDSATYWTRAGQVFILILMFVGGLGIMTIATFMLTLMGQRISLSQRLLVKEGLGVSQVGGLRGLAVRIVVVVVAIQVVGFVALLARFLTQFDATEAVWQAAFHAVSGFNNAGFAVLPNSSSLTAYAQDPVVLGTIGTLTVTGGLGYWVLTDVVRRRRFSLLSLNSKLVLTTSLILIVVGAGVFLASEFHNTATLGPLPLGDKMLNAVFQSISARTAGFATVDFGATRQQTNFFFTSLMAIGGASASVAGGIKVNTFAVVFVAIVSTLRGRTHASAFGREIRSDQVQRAMSIATAAIAFVFLVAFLLAFTESDRAFMDLLFEAVSAFGTVGLSTGITAGLSDAGHAILIVTMLVGRIGPMGAALALMARSERQVFRYAHERVTIG